MPAETRASVRNNLGRTRGAKDRPTSVFHLDKLREAEKKSGFDSLGGAGAAVLSAQEGAQLAEIELEDQTGKAPEDAESERVGLGGWVRRLFSKKVDFQVGGTRIRGKNGFQVRGGTLKLERGAVIDLAPAMLTGRLSQGVSTASGSGGQFYFAPADGAFLLRQTLGMVNLNSDEHISAAGAETTTVQMEENRVELGPVDISKAGRDGASSISFTSTELTLPPDSGAANAVSSNAYIQDGRLHIEEVTLSAKDRRVALFDLDQEGKQLRFHDSKVGKVDTGDGFLTAGCLSDLLSTAAAAEQAEKAVAPAELASSRELELGRDPYSLAGGAVRLNTADTGPRGTGDFVLGANLVTGGSEEYTFDFGIVTGLAQNKAFTMENGLVTADLGTMALTSSDEKKQQNCTIRFVEAEIKNSLLSVGRVEVVQEQEGFQAESTFDGDSPLGQLLNFTIPTMPKRVKFLSLNLPGNCSMEAAAPEAMKRLYSIENLGGLFHISYDAETRAFSLGLEKEAALAEKGFFSADVIPLLSIPLLPGLSFDLSIEPSANMSGGFTIKGALPDKGGTCSLGGEGNFNLEAAIQLNADLTAGVGGILGLYAGLFGAAGAETHTTLGLGMNMSYADRRLSAKSLDLKGAFEAALKGSIGAHAGAKFLVWDVQFFEYTFKEWELMSLSLSSDISKDMTQSFTKGWQVKGSSFEASVLGKQLGTPDVLNVQTQQAVLAGAIKLEGDYQEVLKHLEETVAAFTMIKKQLAGVGQGKSGAVLKSDVIEQHVRGLIALSEKLEGLAEASLQADAALTERLNELRDELERTRAQNAHKVQKHGDRQTYITTAQAQTETNSKLTYKAALEMAKAPMREKFISMEVGKTRLFDLLYEHEKARLEEYKTPLTASRKERERLGHFQEHTRRLDRLDGWKAELDKALLNLKIQPGDSEEEQKRKTALQNQVIQKMNLELLPMIEGRRADEMRAAIGRSVDERMRELDSEDGFTSDMKGQEKLAQLQGADTKERLALRFQYESKRYDELNPKEAERQMNQVVERQTALREIQQQRKGIIRQLSGLKSLPDSVTSDGASEILNQVSVLLEEGTRLKKTWEEFDYVSKSEAARAQQHLYVKEALQRAQVS